MPYSLPSMTNPFVGLPLGKGVLNRAAQLGAARRPPAFTPYQPFVPTAVGGGTVTGTPTGGTPAGTTPLTPQQIQEIFDAGGLLTRAQAGLPPAPTGGLY